MQIENLKEEHGVHGKGWRDEIADRLLNLASKVIKLVSGFPKYNPGLMISNQLMRSITSCGANYEEARGAESRADFIHKMQIVLKEMRESIYWLRLIEKIEITKGPAEVGALIFEATGLSNIVAKSIVTAKKAIAR